MKLSELEEGRKITLRISANSKRMQMDAILKKHLKKDFAQISLLCDTSKVLNFSNVTTDMLFFPSDDIPIIWYDVKITYYEGNYILQVFSEGTKHNRRNYFRVGISRLADLNTLIPGKPRQVTIKDVSLTGFSISDRKKELQLHIGDILSVSWEDLGHILNLTGRVKRIDERDDITIYGFEICNVCNDLSSYVNIKQRRKK